MLRINNLTTRDQCRRTDEQYRRPSFPSPALSYTSDGGPAASSSPNKSCHHLLHGSPSSSPPSPSSSPPSLDLQPPAAYAFNNPWHSSRTSVVPLRKVDRYERHIRSWGWYGLGAGRHRYREILARLYFHRKKDTSRRGKDFRRTPFLPTRDSPEMALMPWTLRTSSLTSSLLLIVDLLWCPLVRLWCLARAHHFATFVPPFPGFWKESLYITQGFITEKGITGLCTHQKY